MGRTGGFATHVQDTPRGAARSEHGLAAWPAAGTRPAPRRAAAIRNDGCGAAVGRLSRRHSWRLPLSSPPNGAFQDAQ